MAKGKASKSKTNGPQKKNKTSVIKKEDRKRSRWMLWTIGSVVIAIVAIWIASLPSGGDESSSNASTPTTERKASTTKQTTKDTTTSPPKPQYTQQGTYELLETYPHDPKAFTQGLELKNSTHFYESVGMYKESAIRIVEMSTGKVIQETKLEDHYFAEGLSICRGSSTDSTSDELILLTWKEKTAFRIHPETLTILDTFDYTTTNGQGWGLACDNEKNRMYVTDGTQFLHTWDHDSMQQISKVPITYRWRNQPSVNVLHNVNELEWDGQSSVLANIWYQDVLARIDPATGFVETIYNLATLHPKEVRGVNEDCLNGIAMDPSSSLPGQTVVWVTGKYWPEMYKVRLTG